jgi:hypothetical protein
MLLVKGMERGIENISKGCWRIFAGDGGNWAGVCEITPSGAERLVPPSKTVIRDWRLEIRPPNPTKKTRGTKKGRD